MTYPGRGHHRPNNAALIRGIRRGRRIRFIARSRIVFRAATIVYGIYRIVKGFRDRAKAEAEIAAQFELTDGERAELSTGSCPRYTPHDP